MDIPRRNPIHREQPTTAGDAPNALPSWDREALALKFQAIDGCTHTEATRQVDEMARSFSPVRPAFSSQPLKSEATRTATVYVRYRTEYPKLWRCLRRTSPLPKPEH